LAATWEDRGLEVRASRGLNGIDGQVSTFLGLARPHSDNWAIIGDLTALYDLAGPWILAQRRDVAATIVVMNNGGGQIFRKMFDEPQFLNQHGLDFEGWSKLWKLPYQALKTISTNALEQAKRRSRIIELIPDAEATAAFNAELRDT
jgi:2-succinyl-5-enolpyruvyl-6-hydroxy-3-cyclohexene-1-carboxylate synthase